MSDAADTPGGNGIAASPGALAGLKVIDLTRVLGGPDCTMILTECRRVVLHLFVVRIVSGTSTQQGIGPRTPKTPPGQANTQSRPNPRFQPHKPNHRNRRHDGLRLDRP